MTYYDEKGNLIEETSDGLVFVNGSCVCEPMTDRDCDRYSIDVQNGLGYYDSFGNFHRYSKNYD